MNKLTNDQVHQLQYLLKGMDSSFCHSKVTPAILSKGKAGVAALNAVVRKYSRVVKEFKAAPDYFTISESLYHSLPCGLSHGHILMDIVWEHYHKRAPRIQQFKIARIAPIEFIRVLNVKRFIHLVKQFKIDDITSIHDSMAVMFLSVVGDVPGKNLRDIAEIYTGIDNEVAMVVKYSNVIRNILTAVSAANIRKFAIGLKRLMYDETYYKDGTIDLLENATEDMILGTIKRLSVKVTPSDDKYLDIAHELSRWDMSQDNMDTAEDWYDIANEKKLYTTIPFVEVKVGKYTLTRLDDLDPRGLTLGQHTDCCQYIGGAGRSSAKHGYTKPNGGFYVVTKEGDDRIQSQAWVWRYGDMLVLDNIESLGSFGRFSKMWRTAAHYITNRYSLGVVSVCVGMGHNDEFKNDGSSKYMDSKILKEAIGDAYTDANRYIVLSHK